MNAEKTRGIGPKAFVVGTLGIYAACHLATYTYIRIRMGEISGSWFPMSSAILFLLILFVLNPLLRLVSRSLELNKTDLLLVFAMLFIGGPLANLGWTTGVFTNLMAPFYDSTSSNAWYEKLGKYMLAPGGPGWLYPMDKNTISWFWESLPAGKGLPWGGWAAPMAYWAVIFAAIYGIMIALSTIMRKQWVENERLIFPLVEPPLALVEDFEKGVRIPPVMRSRLFWVGFGLPVIVFGSQIINAFAPNFPSISLFGQTLISIKPAETWADLNLTLSPLVLAIAFLVKRDVLLSVWLFGLLAYIQTNVMIQVGYSVGPALTGEAMNNPAMAWQSFGAIVVFVLVGLYMARAHLKGVARKALFGAANVDDSNEPMGYRPAVVLLAVSTLTLGVFMLKMGIAPGVAATMIAVLILGYLAVSRFVIEGGLVSVGMPVVATGVAIALFGAKDMTLTCLAGVAACAMIATNFQGGLMPTLLNAMKITEGAQLRRGALLRAAIWSIVFASAVSFVLYMRYCYSLGVTNSQAWTLHYGGNRYFGSIVQSLSNVPHRENARIAWAGGGALVMAVLTFCRYNFSWWPLHPLGFPVAVTGVGQTEMFSIFIAWLSKWLVLRVGGVPLFQKARPIFIGLLVGHLTAAAIYAAVNLFVEPPGIMTNIVPFLM